MTWSRVASRLGLQFVWHCPWEAAQDHAGGPAHNLSGDPSPQPLHNFPLTREALPPGRALGEILQHLLSPRMQSAPAADSEGVVLNTAGFELFPEGLHALPLALVHGDHAIDACSRRRRTDNSNIHSCQAPIVKGASQDIGRAKPWLRSNQSFWFCFSISIDRSGHTVQLITDGIVPPRAVTFGAEQAVHAIASNNSRAAIATDCRILGATATQAETDRSDVLVRQEGL